MAKGKYEAWIAPDGLLLLNAWARDGLTDEEIAAKIGVRRETLYDWKKKHPNISNALKKGKEIVDIEVENALLNNALGFDYIELVPIKLKEEIQKDGQKIVQERVELVEVTKRKLPETVAQFFWLKNRMSGKWRDRQVPQDLDTGRLDEIIKAVKNID